MSRVYPKQYEIWFADLDPSVGSEPGKIRPIVIIQSDVLNKAGHRTTVACAISSLSTAGVSFIRIAIDPSGYNGLLKKSYILCDQIRAIDVSRLKSRIGMLEQIDINRLNASVQAILSL
jgi:mRNA interferase MazF